MIEKGRTDIGDTALSARSDVGLLRYGKIVEGDFRCPLSEMIERASEAGDLRELFCVLTDVLQIDSRTEEKPKITRDEAKDRVNKFINAGWKIDNKYAKKYNIDLGKSLSIGRRQRAGLLVLLEEYFKIVD